MDKQLTTRPQNETGISVNTPNLPVGEARLIELSAGLTIQKIVNVENERAKLEDRLEQCRVNWRDAKRTMLRMETEAAALKEKIAALPDRPSLANTEGGDLVAGQLIAATIRQLNVNSNMDERQIDFAAADILTAYPTLRVEEFAHILRGGITGNFGKTDDFKFDVAVLHRWIKNYYQMKNEKIAIINNNAVRANEVWQERRDKFTH